MAAASSCHAVVEALPLLLLLLLPGLACAQPMQPVQPFKYRMELASGASSIQAARAELARINSVKFTLGPCSGLAPHYHNATELLQPVEGTAHIGYVSGNALIEANVTVGQLFEMPGGMLHYAINTGCAPAAYVAAFPLGTTTQFGLGALAAVGPTLTAWFASAPLPTALGMPFTTNAACLQRCNEHQEAPPAAAAPASLSAPAGGGPG